MGPCGGAGAGPTAGLPGLLGGLLGHLGRQGHQGGRGNQGHRGPHGGRGGRFGRGPFRGCGPFGGHGQRADGTEKTNAQGGGCGAWRLKRAKVVSVPSAVLAGVPGETLIATVDFVNNTQQPHKPGCVFRSVFTGKAAELVEEAVVPVDF